MMKELVEVISSMKAYGPILYAGVLFYAILLLQIPIHDFTPVEEIAVLVAGSVLVVVGFLEYRQRFLVKREMAFKEMDYYRKKEEDASKRVEVSIKRAQDLGNPPTESKEKAG